LTEVADSQRLQLQNERGAVDSLNLRRQLCRRTIQPILLRTQPVTNARLCPSSPACPLFTRGFAGRHCDEGIGVSDFDKAAIDYVDYSVYGDGGFGYVRGYYDFARVYGRWFEYLQLLLKRKVRITRDTVVTLVLILLTKLINKPVYFTLPRQKDQNITRCFYLMNNSLYTLKNVVFCRFTQVLDLNGKLPSRY